MKNRFFKRLISIVLMGAMLLPIGIVEASAASAADFEQFIIDSLKSCPTEIDVTDYAIPNGWDKNTAKQKTVDIITNTPELFYVNASVGWRGKSTYSVITQLKYTMTYDEAQALYKDYKANTFEQYLEKCMNARANEINITLYYMENGWNKTSAMAAYEDALTANKSLPYNSTKASWTFGDSIKRKCVISNIDYSAAGSKSASAEGSFEEYIVKQLENFSSEIDILDYYTANNWNKDEAMEAFLDVLINNPDLFYVSSSIVIRQLTSTNTGKLKECYFSDISYIAKKSKISSMKKKFDAEVETALACVTDDMTDVEKALALHDYIAATCEYDQSVLDGNTSDSAAASWTAYGALVEKVAVCQGYSLAYACLLKECGIDATLISSEKMNHAWNYVKIDNKWYHVDITHDDPVTPNSLGTVLHENFLLSDAGIKKTDHYGWTTNGLPKASSSKYNKYFWQKSESNIVYIDGVWYYTDYDEDSPCFSEPYTGIDAFKMYTNVYKYSFKTNKSTKLTTIQSVWPSWGINLKKTISYTLGSFVRLAVNDGTIYYNTYNKIYTLTTAGKVKEFYSPAITKGYIYGIKIADGKLYYALKKAPDAADIIKSKAL